MKRGILFVDDERMVLDGLRRMLHPMRNEWDMEFLESGMEALNRMEERSFDVVVADMRMPGMTGAELLNQVMKRHPKTVRLILSGHADKDLILQCVGSTHQYLSKPCNADALKATVLRASSLDSILQNDRLKLLVGKMRQLPSISSLYMEIVEKANEPDAPLEEVARIIVTDPGMTANILKLVNSAFFGLKRELSSAAEAVGYIGLDTIKALVLSIHAFTQFSNPNQGGLMVESLWEHSMRVAARSKRIAKLEDAENKTVDEAFTAGILHDVGKLVLAANLPDEYALAMEMASNDKLEFRDAETHVFGANHADVGGYLLGLWGLPVPVVEAIVLHHQPEQSTHAGFCALSAVHAADALEWELSQASPNVVRSQLNMEYLKAINKTDRIDVWREPAEYDL